MNISQVPHRVVAPIADIRLACPRTRLATGALLPLPSLGNTATTQGRSLAWIGRIKNMIMGRKADKLHICPSAKATLATPLGTIIPREPLSSSK
jgi:hypothetical protein